MQRMSLRTRRRRRSGRLHGHPIRTRRSLHEPDRLEEAGRSRRRRLRGQILRPRNQKRLRRRPRHERGRVLRCRPVETSRRRQRRGLTRGEASRKAPMLRSRPTSIKHAPDLRKRQPLARLEPRPPQQLRVVVPREPLLMLPTADVMMAISHAGELLSTERALPAMRTIRTSG